MFENMMKYEKAWNLFCEWLYDKYDISYNNKYYCYQKEDIDCGSFAFFLDNLILNLIPDFMDEQGLYIIIDFHCGQFS